MVEICHYSTSLCGGGVGGGGGKGPILAQSAHNY